MKIIMMDPAKLKLADYNPRRMNKAQEAALTESIKKFNFAEPVVVNMHPKRKGFIIGGHQRVLVARKLKFKEIPCVHMVLAPDQEKELNVRLNKNTGEFDMEKLLKEFEVPSLLEWGFEKKELDVDVAALLDKPTPAKKVRANVEVQFQLGELRFTLPQEIYVRWMDALAKEFGMKKAPQVTAVKKRLRIDETPIKGKGKK